MQIYVKVLGFQDLLTDDLYNTKTGRDAKKRNCKITANAGKQNGTQWFDHK